MLYVLGMGNVLLKDDGVGVRVAQELLRRELPPGIEVFDIGTGILRMLPELVKAQRIIVIDAVRAGGEPGSVYHFRAGEPKAAATRSVHDIQFDEVLAHLRLLGCEPQVEYYGIEPAQIGFSLELSDAVASRVPLLAEYLVEHVLNAPSSAHRG